jgi:5'-deoxynucleotidase YfbR-like HD superfamily hydrolase
MADSTRKWGYQNADGTWTESDDYSDDKGKVTYDVDAFEQLLASLEGSKKRQTRQKSVEGRRDIYAQGLASMMGNF